MCSTRRFELDASLSSLFPDHPEHLQGKNAVVDYCEAFEILRSPDVAAAIGLVPTMLRSQRGS
jgi:hypothetical protein